MEQCNCSEQEKYLRFIEFASLCTLPQEYVLIDKYSFDTVWEINTEINANNKNIF